MSPRESLLGGTGRGGGGDGGDEAAEGGTDPFSLERAFPSLIFCQSAVLNRICLTFGMAIWERDRGY